MLLGQVCSGFALVLGCGPKSWDVGLTPKVWLFGGFSRKLEVFTVPTNLKGLKFQTLSSWPQTVLNICQAFWHWLWAGFPSISLPACTAQGCEGNSLTDFRAVLSVASSFPGLL